MSWRRLSTLLQGNFRVHAAFLNAILLEFQQYIHNQITPQLSQIVRMGECRVKGPRSRLSNRTYGPGSFGPLNPNQNGDKASIQRIKKRASPVLA
jgi:hypothetical protein